MPLPDFEAMFSEMADHVKRFTARAVEPLRERMTRIDADVASRPTVDAMRAAIAESSAKLALDFVTMVSRSADGKPINVEDVRPIVESAIAALPKPKDGEPGKSVDPAHVAALVDGAIAKAVAAIPVPQNGAPGDRGGDGAPGVKGDPGERGEKGERGADAPGIDPVAVEAMVDRAVAVKTASQQEAEAAWAKDFSDALVSRLMAATVE